MSLKFAKKCNLQIAPARIEAQAAGSSELCVIGQSQNPITIEVDFSGTHIPVDLGHVAVINNLGSDLLIGEPGKKTNKIITLPHARIVQIFHNNTLLSTPYLEEKIKYCVARVQSTQTIHKGENFKWPVPKNFTNHSHLVINPRSKDEHWFIPGVYSIDSSNTVCLKNVSGVPDYITAEKSIC